MAFSDSSMRHVKLCLVGNSAVGKTCIAARLIYNTYNPLTEHSIGAAYGTKDTIVENQAYRMHIWDTAGQERFASMIPLYYRNAHAVIIVFDITSPESFSAVKKWSKEVNLHTSPELILAIAGNKFDLQEERNIEKKVGKGCAEDIGAMYFETSAADGTNIQEMFQKIVRTMHRQSMFQVEAQHKSLEESTSTKSKKCFC